MDGRIGVSQIVVECINKTIVGLLKTYNFNFMWLWFCFIVCKKERTIKFGEIMKIAMQTICTNGSSFTVDAVLVFDQTNICRNQSSIQPLLHAICTREIERLADWQKSANSHHVRHSTPQMRNRRSSLKLDRELAIGYSCPGLVSICLFSSCTSFNSTDAKQTYEGSDGSHDYWYKSCCMRGIENGDEWEFSHTRHIRQNDTKHRAIYYVCWGSNGGVGCGTNFKIPVMINKSFHHSLQNKTTFSSPKKYQHNR